MLEVSPSRGVEGGSLKFRFPGSVCPLYSVNFGRPQTQGSYLESRRVELYKTGFGRKKCGCENCDGIEPRCLQTDWHSSKPPGSEGLSPYSI